MEARPSSLEHLGYRLGRRLNRPAAFTPTLAWSTSNYSFQLDTKQLIGRRLSVDANPTVYFRIEPLVAQSNKIRLTRRPLQFAFASVALAAVFLLLYPLIPAVQYQVRSEISKTISHTNALAATPASISETNRVIIPKIGVTATILEGRSLAVLNHADGVWHETGTEADNLVLAGHRFKYLPPNTTTLYSLDKVSAGDTIVVDWYHKRYIYVVTGIKTVDKTDIGVRNPTATPTLTIYSCEETNMAHRIVVTAKRLD